MTPLLFPIIFIGGLGKGLGRADGFFPSYGECFFFLIVGRWDYGGEDDRAQVIHGGPRRLVPGCPGFSGFPPSFLPQGWEGEGLWV